jgi:hypothetical protein
MPAFPEHAIQPPTNLLPGEASPPGTIVTTLTPTLTWSGPPNAEIYSVAVSQVGGATVLQEAIKGRTVTLPSLQAGATYQWSVLAEGLVPAPGGTGLVLSHSASAVAYFATELPAPGGGNNNYFLADSKGAALTGLTVTIFVTEDIVPDNGEPFGFQINCDSPAQSSGASPVVWQQYMFVATQNELCFLVNNWREQDLSGGPLFQWDSRPKPSNTAYNAVVPLPQTNNILPKGWQLTMTLLTDPNNNNNVTGFTFSIAQPDGTVLTSPPITLLSLNPSAVAANLSPIENCTVLLIKNNGGTTTDFSAGQGIFQCFTTGNLTASLSAGASGIVTKEDSNVSYSSMPTSNPNGAFDQLFGIGLVP